MHRQTARPKPDRTEIKFDEATARVLERAQSFSNYLGSFDAITSIFSIEGDFVRSSDAFSFKACATLPFRCASRPESSANVSKIPYVDGPILMANQDTVFGSASTNTRPVSKNFSTSASLPGVFLFLWDYVAVNAAECQMLAIIRQLPNHVSILAIIGVEILDARKRRLCD